jgi:rhodanese-related sulfurtransferase
MTRRVDPLTLATRLGTADWPAVIDVRRAAVAEASGRWLPAARWRDPDGMADWVPALAGRPVLVYCAHGHQLSQAAAAQLVAKGMDATVLEGGFDAWEKAGLPSIGRQAAALPRPSQWVTRERPKIDRIACPWLVRRFVDPAARFSYVPNADVRAFAEANDATPYDVPDVDFSHRGDECSFDAFIRRYRLDDPALATLATIVRGADTGALDLAAEASGLLAVSLGLSRMIADDHAMLRFGMLVYDALYARCRDAMGESHGWNPGALRVPAAH